MAAAADASRARRLASEMGLGHPGVDLFAGDLIEALARTGSPNEALSAVGELEMAATRCDHRLGMAVAKRGRILLARDGEIDALAAEAMALHDLMAVPFERARTELVLGERLRRAGRRRDGRVVLVKAHADFTRLGAAPWASRAHAELRAAGGRVGPEGGPVPAEIDLLSPQEQQVARLVADGATNQEAATTMFLSTKSIERHLTAIYRKLDLRSRSELTRWFDRQTATTEPT